MGKAERADLKSFLDEKADVYNSTEFIGTDPIQVPHQFEDQYDIEISAFLTAILSWGRKSTIISNARNLVSMMPGGPHRFVMEHRDDDLDRFIPFVHRTFNGIDCIYFLGALRNIYHNHGGLGGLFQEAYAAHGDIFQAVLSFREKFFRHADPGRTAKHIADLGKGASGKRIHMFLRWMVRVDTRGVDFGIWKGIPMHALYMPLDVHTGNVARKLGLLDRKQNDWKAVVELTGRLREFDPEDPVRYDFALFGLGSLEKF